MTTSARGTGLGRKELALIDAWWRAANYLSVGQIYLMDNPLLREPLRPEHVKPRLLGHWGTTPGLNFVYAHLNRAITAREQKMMYIIGPGHGGPGLVASAWLEGTYSEVYPEVSLDEEGMDRLFTQFSFPGGIPSHVAPETPGSIHEGGELGYALSHAYGAAFDNPDLVVCCVVGDGEAEGSCNYYRVVAPAVHRGLLRSMTMVAGSAPLARQHDAARLGVGGEAPQRFGGTLPFLRARLMGETSYPAATHGKVFFRGPDGYDYMCSGTAVASPKGDLVATAGHCLYDPREGGYASEVVFVPAYLQGEAPYGTWRARSLHVMGRWTHGDFRYDFGLFRVTRDEEGRRLQDVVGARGLGFGVPVDAVVMPDASHAAEVMDGVPVRRVRGWPSGWDLRWAPGVASVIWDGDWDIVHLQGIHTLVAPIAMAAARRAHWPATPRRMAAP